MIRKNEAIVMPAEISVEIQIWPIDKLAVTRAGTTRLSIACAAVFVNSVSRSPCLARNSTWYVRPEDLLLTSRVGNPAPAGTHRRVAHPRDASESRTSRSGSGGLKRKQAVYAAAQKSVGPKTCARGLGGKKRILPPCRLILCRSKFRPTEDQTT
jgi:hypothetical protein